MNNRDDDLQEPGFLDEQNLPKRRRAGRHHREYRSDASGAEWVKVGLILAFIAAATAIVVVLIINQIPPRETATEALFRAIMERAMMER